MAKRTKKRRLNIKARQKVKTREKRVWQYTRPIFLGLGYKLGPSACESRQDAKPKSLGYGYVISSSACGSDKMLDLTSFDLGLLRI
jgi:hypothetical protein